MTKETSIKLFESKKIRSHWDAEQEKWYFSIVDIIEALTDSVNPTDYLKKLRKRDEILGIYIGTNCPQIEMETITGKKRKTLSGDIQQIFRIIQSIPSPKAEPFKMWLAKVGYERIEETEDPEIAFDRAMETYLKMGYSTNWINQRLKSIEVRKELTDEWENRGVQKGQEFAILTDEITKAWAGLTTKQYKNLKNLKKENLRDNMTNLELVLNMLAETSTTELSKKAKPKTLFENKKIARKGGTVAGNARKDLESKLGEKIITPLNAKELGKKNNFQIEETNE